MRQSKLFSKTRKEAPKDELSKNAVLLIKAGFINKEASGVYSLLPLGLKVIEKISDVLRKHMVLLGANEILMSALQDPEPWQISSRWSDDEIDIWFKTTLKNGGEMGLGFTHEEPIVRLALSHLNSYKDLPTSVFQIQNKFRNELRAKSGIIRGREFLMKDLYSFALSEQEHKDFYQKVKETYKNIFEEVGIGDKTIITFASGGAFSKYSEEFQTVCDSGEDNIWIDQDSGIAINDEVFNQEVCKDLGVEKEKMIQQKTVEVGNIFNLGTKYSDSLGLNLQDINGEKKSVIMGSYGIGLGRLMGVVAETLSDEKGLVWPETISPFKYHLITLADTDDVKRISEKIYNSLLDKKIEVLYDDRDLRAGEKLNDSDLIGISNKILVGNKTTESQIEIVERKTGKVRIVSPEDIF